MKGEVFWGCCISEERLSELCQATRLMNKLFELYLTVNMKTIAKFVSVVLYSDTTACTDSQRVQIQYQGASVEKKNQSMMSVNIGKQGDRNG